MIQRKSATKQINQHSHFTAYDLVDIYPFLLYRPQKDEKLEEIAKKIEVSKDTLRSLNKLAKGTTPASVKSEGNAGPQRL